MFDTDVLKPATIIIKRDDIVMRTFGNHTILACPESKHPFRLNESGTEIWELMDSHKRVIDLIDAVNGLYKVDRDMVSVDIISFLTELMKQELIRAG